MTLKKCVLEKLDKPSHDQNVQVQDLKIVILRPKNLIQNIVHPKNILNALKSSLQNFLILANLGKNHCIGKCDDSSIYYHSNVWSL